VHAYKTKISGLWEKLYVDEAERREFLQRNAGLSSAVLLSLQVELTRLEDFKRGSVHLIISHARKDLSDLWAKLYFTEDEISEFTPAFTETCNETILSAHEDEIERLKGIILERAPILTQIQRYEDLLEEQRDLEMLTQDSSSLMGRHAGQRHNLLQEERIRKRLARELPRTENWLEQLLIPWEEEHELFFVHGEHYLRHIQNLIASRAEGRPKKSTLHTPRQASALAPVSINTRGSPTRSSSRALSSVIIKNPVGRSFTPNVMRNDEIES